MCSAAPNSALGTVLTYTGALVYGLPVSLSLRRIISPKGEGYQAGSLAALHPLGEKLGERYGHRWPVVA